MFGETYLATIALFAGNFEPEGWNYCDGRLLSIAANEALFTLLGTTFGGDGIETFALPDLRSRVAVHAGQGPGLQNHSLGDKGGSETMPITVENLPQHSHALISFTGKPPASTDPGTLSEAPGNIPATTVGINNYNSSGTGNMAATQVVTVTPAAGGTEPMSNISPVLAMNYVIAVEGIFPVRG